MLCNMVKIEMAKGKSGRIVIEIDPKVKSELYQELEKENSNLKAWFLEHVESFLKGRQQYSLGLNCSDITPASDKDTTHEV